MTRQEIYLKPYEWTVQVYCGTEREDADEVCDAIARMGCTGNALHEAKRHLQRGEKNSGLTYSNTAERKSVVAIGGTTSAGEFVNTVAHEMFHVVFHICGALGIRMESEEPCYMIGWLCQSVINNNQQNFEQYDRH